MACKERRIEVHLNGIRQFSSSINADADFILALSGSIEALRNDIINIVGYHESSTDIEFTPSVQIFRVTYGENHNKDSGQNIIENEDGTNG